MHPLETYLSELREIRSTGADVPEQSYYGDTEGTLKSKPGLCRWHTY